MAKNEVSIKILRNYGNLFDEKTSEHVGSFTNQVAVEMCQREQNLFYGFADNGLRLELIRQREDYKLDNFMRVIRGTIQIDLEHQRFSELFNTFSQNRNAALIYATGCGLYINSLVKQGFPIDRELPVIKAVMSRCEHAIKTSFKQHMPWLIEFPPNKDITIHQDFWH